MPFVAWPGPGLPGWAGSLDLVVVLAPEGRDTGTAGAVAEAVRRGCQVVVAAPEKSLVAEHAPGRYATVLPTADRRPARRRRGRARPARPGAPGPADRTERDRRRARRGRRRCGPHRDIAVNPAKILAIGIADANPLIWGGTVLAARAARRIAESLRRATGRTALAADAEHLLPVLAATAPADVFADPFADGGRQRRPALVLLDDGSTRPGSARDPRPARGDRQAQGVRVETISSEADGRRRPLRRDALHRHVRRGVPPARFFFLGGGGGGFFFFFFF